MAKYTIDSSTLTDIADAIRTQYDDDSPINPLDMAEAILGIEGGGSEIDFPFVVDSGEFTLVNSLTDRDVPYVISHSCEKIPLMVFFVLDDYTSFPPFSTLGGYGVFINNAVSGAVTLMKNYQGNISGNVNRGVISSVDSDKFGIIPYEASYPIRTGTIKWIALAL